MLTQPLNLAWELLRHGSRASTRAQCCPTLNPKAGLPPRPAGPGTFSLTCPTKNQSFPRGVGSDPPGPVLGSTRARPGGTKSRIDDSQRTAGIALTTWTSLSKLRKDGNQANAFLQGAFSSFADSNRRNYTDATRQCKGCTRCRPAKYSQGRPWKTTCFCLELETKKQIVLHGKI